jgi:hypothetical protein
VTGGTHARTRSSDASGLGAHPTPRLETQEVKCVTDVPLWLAYGLMLGFVIVMTALALWLLKRGVGLRS